MTLALSRALQGSGALRRAKLWWRQASPHCRGRLRLFPRTCCTPPARIEPPRVALRSFPAEAGLPLWVRAFEVVVTSDDTALIELIPDALSIHTIKARSGVPRA